MAGFSRTLVSNEKARAEKEPLASDDCEEGGDIVESVQVDVPNIPEGATVEQQIVGFRIVLLVCILIWGAVGWYAATQVPWGHDGVSLTTIEAFYWMSQILTTVGYGDFPPPATRSGHVFMVFYLTFAGLVIASYISATVMNAINAEKSMLEGSVVHAVEETLTGAITVTKTGWLMKFACGEGLSHEAKDFLYAFAQWSACVVVWSTFFVYYPGEEKGWSEAVYMGVVTLTTIGFGDVTPRTEEGKLFAAIGMLIGVQRFAHCVAEVSCWLLEVITVQNIDAKTLDRILQDPYVNKAIAERQKFVESLPNSGRPDAIEYASCWSSPLGLRKWPAACLSTKALVERQQFLESPASADRAGSTIARNDFTVFLLLDMGIAERDTIDKIHKQFDLLDRTGDGFLDFADIPDNHLIKRPTKRKHIR